VDCWASSTFPSGDWEKDQRPAIDAWARAHELAVQDGKTVSSWDLDPDRPTITNDPMPRKASACTLKYLPAAWAYSERHPSKGVGGDSPRGPGSPATCSAAGLSLLSGQECVRPVGAGIVSSTTRPAHAAPMPAATTIKST
jgi:hypothetical protein